VVEVPQIKGFFVVRYDILRPGRVSVIVAPCDRGAMLGRCLESIFYKTAHPDYEVILPETAAPEVTEVVLKWQRAEPGRLRIVPLAAPTAPPTPSRSWARAVDGRYLLLLSGETTVTTEDWMTAMVEQAQRPSIGAVGALLLHRDGSIRHAGAVLGRGGEVAHSHRGLPASTVGYAGQVVSVNNYLAVSGACLMCRRDLFLELGPPGEGVADGQWDVDFCLRLFEKGYWNVHLPHVRLFQGGREARVATGAEKAAVPARESDCISSRWPRYEERDPCYSPHLTRRDEDYGMRVVVDGIVLKP
jgi:GT2 family glycosyltransferase